MDFEGAAWRAAHRVAALPRLMRLVLQRVTEASVTVDGKVVGSIGRGLVALCGIHETDDDKAAEWAARKLLNTRLFEDEKGKMWSQSVASLNLGVLLVSQFTLFAQLKGNKPDFHNAMGPQRARPYWSDFVQRVEGLHTTGPVATGEFGAKMQVSLINDGPVTIELESPPSSPPPNPLQPPQSPPLGKASGGGGGGRVDGRATTPRMAAAAGSAAPGQDLEWAWAMQRHLRSDLS